MSRLPGGVVVVAVLAIVNGILNLITGLLFTIGGSLGWLVGLLGVDAAQAIGGGAVVGGLTSIVTGLLHIIAGFGLVSRQGWAWLLALLSCGLALVAPLIALFSGQFWALLGMFVPAVILWYLLTPEVRQAFGRAPAGDVPAA